MLEVTLRARIAELREELGGIAFRLDAVHQELGQLALLLASLSEQDARQQELPLDLAA